MVTYSVAICRLVNKEKISVNVLSNWKTSIVILIILSVLYIPLMKKLVSTLQPSTIMFFVTFIILIGFTILNVFNLKNNSFKINAKEIFLLLSVGIVALIINYITLSTIKTIPNAGYIRIVNVLSMIITVLFCTIIFKDEFTIKKFIGIFLCTIGGVLVLV